MNYKQAVAMPLRRGRKWYVVYMPDRDDEYVQASSHADAERIANRDMPTNLGVAYTEL